VRSGSFSDLRVITDGVGGKAQGPREMEVIFLGTGSAWALPEHGCKCRICRNMSRLGEERLRTALFLRASEDFLVDCGPDIRLQLMKNQIQNIDAILVTHGHGDHYIGLDELEALRRSRSRHEWVPIPTFASEKTWEIIGRRFDYLIDKLLERRSVTEGEPIEKLKTRVTPFRTIHSGSAEGSVGYVFEENTPAGPRKLVYTSDFIDVTGQEALLSEPDVLITQSHFFQEPTVNRPGHMSFQRVVEFIRRWRPKSGVFLVHISDADAMPGDKANDSLKKFRPADPILNPMTGFPYEVPTCQSEWQERGDQIVTDWGLPCKITVAHDGLRAVLW